MYKVSIIVPVYNNEKFLNKCIDSIINQTHKNTEIILVNDGSTDKSIQICKFYEKLDVRIIVIDKKNGGVSSARNAGLKISSGDFVMFVDSDDIIHPQMIEIMLETSIKYKNSIVACGVLHHYSDLKIIDKCLFIENNINNKINIYNKEEAILYALNPKLFSGFVCNKIFPIKILKNNSIFFNEDIHACEDLLFCFFNFLHIEKLIFIDIKLYNYNHHETNSMNKVSIKKLTLIEAYEIIIDQLISLNQFNIASKYIKKYYNSIISLYFQSVNSKNKVITELLNNKINRLPSYPTNNKFKIYFKFFNIVKYPLYLIWKIRRKMKKLNRK